MVSVQVRPTQRAVAQLRVRLVILGVALFTGVLLAAAGIVTLGLADSRMVRLGAMGLLLFGVFLVLVSLVRLRRPAPH